MAGGDVDDGLVDGLCLSGDGTRLDQREEGFEGDCWLDLGFPDMIPEPCQCDDQGWEQKGLQ